ncbi:MAG: hypothetical protein ABI363_06400 [Nitrosospira sp.]
MTYKLFSPISHGELLLEEFMKPMGVSINAFSPEIWLDLQSDYSIRMTRRTVWPKIERLVRVHAG